MGDLKSQLQAIFPPAPICPESHKWGSIAELYAAYQNLLEDRFFKDPDGHQIYFRAKDFPHLVKLEFEDRKQNRWVDANAKAAIPQLQAGTLDEARYRIVDKSRARTIFWIPDIISSPDSIHPNKRNCKNDVYAKRYSRKGQGKTLKIVLVQIDRDGTKSVQTSFWSDEVYHAGCVSHPPRHKK